MLDPTALLNEAKSVAMVARTLLTLDASETLDIEISGPASVTLPFGPVVESAAVELRLV